MIMYVCVCVRALFLYVGRHSSRGHLSFLNIVYVARVKHFRTFLCEKHFTNELYLFNLDWFPLSFAEVDLLTFETSDVFLLNLHKNSHLCFFSQISWQLLDGFPWSEVNIFSPPSVWIDIALLMMCTESSSDKCSSLMKTLVYDQKSAKKISRFNCI